MKSLFLLLHLFAFLTLKAQNPKAIMTVSGTQMYPSSTTQSSWTNNQWNGLFFYASTGLCVTDGTLVGTKFLANVGSGSIQRIIPAKDFVYIFTALLVTPSPYTFRYEIWKSDGTVAGTSYVTTLPDAIGLSNLNQFCSDGASVFNYSLDGTTNTMYFGAYDGTNGNELWVTDGTATGTHIVKNIKAGLGGSNPWGFFKIGNEVFFNCNEVGFEKKLWKTDGTNAGTVKVSVAEPFYIVNGNVGKLGNKILFYAHNTVNGYEPYVSDGTAAGTFMLKDINPSGNSLLAASQEMHLKSNSKYSFFIANNGTDTTLWRTDGTTDGTIRLSQTGTSIKNNVSSGGYSDIDENGLWMIEYNAGGTGNAQKIYKSDGTLNGTYLAAQNNSYGQNAKIYKNALWMQARNTGAIYNTEPWRCGGNQATTNIAFEIFPGTSPAPTSLPYSSNPFGFFEKNNKLYFFATASSGPVVNLYEYNGDFTFNGSLAGGRWRDSANWNSMMPPALTDTVFINSGTPNSLTIDGATAYAGVLNLGNNTTIQFSNNTDSLIINNKLNSGSNTSFSGAGNLVFKNIINDTVQITNDLLANNIVVQSNTNVQSGSLTINNSIQLTNGKLILNNNNLILTGTSATALANQNAYVVTNGSGSMQIQNIGLGARVGVQNFPIGTSSNYNPVSFTNTGTADNFTARVQPNLNGNYIGEIPDNSTYTNGAVAATWFLNEQTVGGSVAEIGLQWNQVQENAGFDRSQSYLGHYTSGTWSLGTVGSAIGSGPFNYSRTGITSFSPFGILNSGATLPLQFVSFSAQKCNSTEVCLNWKTANEQDVSHFEIEKSTDGFTFSKIGTRVAYNQTSNAYHFNDNISNTTKLFYRIKQIDKIGSFHYSKIVAITTNANSFTVFPTIFTNSITIQNNSNDVSVLQIYTSEGKLISQNVLKAGVNNIVINNNISGMLFYKIIKNNDVLQSGKLIAVK
jgi:ELWxxDGT repeat protein